MKYTIILFGIFLLCCCSTQQKPKKPVNPSNNPTFSRKVCEVACKRWEAAGCKQAQRVCDGFDAKGKCDRYLTCADSCMDSPQAYWGADEVAKLPASAKPTCKGLK